MKLSTKKLYLTLFAGSGIILTACNGGSTTNGNNDITNSEALQAQVPSVKSLFNTSSCLSGKVNFSGKDWYISGNLAITNTCNADQYLNGKSISFVSQNLADPSQIVNFTHSLDNWYINGGHYSLSLISGGSNTVSGVINAEDNTNNGVIHPNQTIEFGGGINMPNNISGYDTTTANASLVVDGEAPIAQKGSLTVNINTESAGCTKSTCGILKVDVKDSIGNIVATINVPTSSIGGIYSQKIESMTVGSYNLSSSSLVNSVLNYNPSAISQVQANQNSNINIIYTKAPQFGSANITLPVLVSSYTGKVQMQILNSKESNAVVNTYSIAQGETIDIGNLPISDSTHTYKVKLQGIADPINGNYYIESGLPTLSIKNGKTTNLTIPYKISTIVKRNVKYNVSGLSTNDSVTVNFQDSAQKYVYPTYSSVKNGNTTYLIENNTNLGYVVTASGSYTPNPIESTVLIKSNQTLNVAFTPYQPSGKTVVGWPDYLAMGAVGGPNIDRQNQITSGGDDSFGGKPVDVVFKYAGVNGNGDPGVIDPPMNALRMTKDLALVSEYNKHPSRVAIVEYTGEMSGGENFADFTNTSVPNPSKQDATYIMARHFVSLGADAIALADRPVVYAGKKYYGSLIMNPDLLGAMQQNNYVGSVNQQLPANAVNKAVDQTLCLLTNVRSYTNQSMPNGDGNYTYKNKTYTGTPYGILTQMLDDGYPEWSISGASDPYWNTAINNDGAQVGKWFDACIANPSYDTNKYSHPNFAAGFDGWVQANNWLIRAFAPKSTTQVTFGWQNNMWASGSGFWLHKDMTANQIASSYSTPMINWLKTHAPSTIDRTANAYTPDYFIFDRYETDDSSAPGQATLYSARSWDNYLTAIGQVSKAFGDIPLMMWQIPGSHLPYIGEVNPENFNNIAGSYIFSTAPVYFFGDSNLKSDLSNLILGGSTTNANIGVGSFAMLSDYNCPIVGCNYKDYLRYYNGQVNNYDWSKDNGKLALAASNNVFAILWGGGNTTNVIKNFSNPDDHGWLANKIKSYYQNPTYLK